MTESEIWKQIPGYPFYWASSLWRIKVDDRHITRMHKGSLIRQFRAGRVLHGCIGARGYLAIGIAASKRVYVHHLVLFAFHGVPKEGVGLNAKVGNHKNGIRTDNRPENLEWVTASENLKHAYATGLKRKQFGDGRDIRGVLNNKAKLDDDKVREIMLLLAQQRSCNSVANMFGVSKKTILNIKHGRTWKHVVQFL